MTPRVKPGPRIVKPRTAKQRAHFNRFKREAPYAAPPLTPGPSTSWWAGTSRDELRARIAEEQPRMSSSRFGRLVGSGVL